MESKEFAFKGLKLNGFLMVFLELIIIAACATFMCFEGRFGDIVFIGIPIIFLSFIFILPGFVQLEPNETMVMIFFGEYRGTLSQTGFFWVHPFISAKKLSLRARNLDIKPIKVNDKIGNPIMIGLVLVWRLKDTYKSMFEIDAQTMAEGNAGNAASIVSGVGRRMAAFEKFVSIQSDAALREVAGIYAYDNNETNSTEKTLRNGGDEVNAQLEDKLNERLDMAGIEIVEARLNYLAYAPEIAAVMLRRQQASAIIMAREKIVEGAVSMVKLALDKLSEDQIVELDEEKKAAMVSNLLVVLCADESAQPVVNAGTLNH